MTLSALAQSFLRSWASLTEGSPVAPDSTDTHIHNLDQNSLLDIFLRLGPTSSSAFRETCRDWRRLALNNPKIYSYSPHREIEGNFDSAVFNSDGTSVTARTRDAVKRYDIRTGQEQEIWETPGFIGNHSKVSISPSGDCMLMADYSEIRLLNFATGKIVSTPRSRGSEPRFRFSPDGKKVAFVNFDRQRKRYTIDTYALVKSEKLHFLTSITISPISHFGKMADINDFALGAHNQLAVAFEDQPERLPPTYEGTTIIRYSSNESFRSYTGPSAHKKLAFSPTSKKLLAFRRGAVDICSVVNPEAQTHDFMVPRALVFSRYGHSILISMDDRVRLYDINSWKVIDEFHYPNVTAVAFSSDENYAMLASSSKISILARQNNPSKSFPTKAS